MPPVKPPTKSRRELYSEATRSALLASATTLFVRNGFGKTTLDDVATDARVTRGAVYHHFANKGALFHAVFDELETQANRRFLAAVQRATNWWDGVVASLDEFLDQCCDPVYGKLIWQEGPIALGWQEWKACEEKYGYGLIYDSLRTGIANGEIVELPVESATRMVFAMLGAAGQALAEAAKSDKPRIRDEWADLIRLFLAGIRQPNRR